MSWNSRILRKRRRRRGEGGARRKAQVEPISNFLFVDVNGCWLLVCAGKMLRHESQLIPVKMIHASFELALHVFMLFTVLLP